jgi:hypothetical protein
MQERTFLLKTYFRDYSNKEINARLLEDIINSNYDTWDFLVLIPDKPIHDSTFMQVGAPKAHTDSQFFLEIGFGDIERTFILYLLTTEDKNIVLRYLIAYLVEQVIPDISLWEDISDILPN